MNDYSDLWHTSADKLDLYARFYIKPHAPLTLICLHGLTRNCADFNELCQHFKPDYQILALDQRGRGRSAYDKQPNNYQLPVYVQDTLNLIEQQNINNIVLVGTSMGGLMSIAMANLLGDKLKGIILNDVGPEVEQRGLNRIKSYTGKTQAVSNWDQAIVQTKAINQIALPNYTDKDWYKFTHNLYQENEQGIPILAYDPAIAEPMRTMADTAVAPDLWPFFDTIKDIPTLLVHGESSDILVDSCVQKMQQRKPDLKYIKVKDRGHAPMLDEPQSIQAITAFLNQLT